MEEVVGKDTAVTDMVAAKEVEAVRPTFGVSVGWIST